MKKVIVLGGGMVGSAMAIDLARQHRVTLADMNRGALGKALETCGDLEILPLDVTQETDLKEAVAGHDLVINAVPGFLGFETLKRIIETGRSVVDIAFFPENALELDGMAREHGVTAIVDCGVAPGMDNLILGRYNELMKISRFECLVGGVPKAREWPFCYKAPFSPVDVIEEYTRPARYVEHGEVVIREPLTDVELVEFDGVGTLEAFNSDGLRSLIHTMPHIPHMKEKTLRYPGHAEYVKVLKESGFFDTDPVLVNGVQVTPLEFTSRILFGAWKLEEGEEELTVMRVTMRGENHEGKQEEVVYDLYDAYCPGTKTSSMARTTGYTATAAANMLLEGLFDSKGIFPPELVGSDPACFDYILRYLKERGIQYKKRTRLLHL
jgi:saccharopine dehydrogenase-like NADP-dependent oxidoreductase